MRLIGKSRALQNPNTCNQCFEFISTHHGGAEIEASMLFADIRGSTTIAERLSPTEFRALLDRFYTVAMRVVFTHNGSFDKFVGDELVALFFPLITGPNHAEQAVKAARALLVASRPRRSRRTVGPAGRRRPHRPDLVRRGWRGRRDPADGRWRRDEHDGPPCLDRPGRRDPRDDVGSGGSGPGPRARAASHSI